MFAVLFGYSALSYLHPFSYHHCCDSGCRRCRHILSLPIIIGLTSGWPLQSLFGSQWELSPSLSPSLICNRVDESNFKHSGAEIETNISLDQYLLDQAFHRYKIIRTVAMTTAVGKEWWIGFKLSFHYSVTSTRCDTYCLLRLRVPCYLWTLELTGGCLTN